MTTLVQPIRGPAESQASDHSECGRLNDNAVAEIVAPSSSLFWVPDGANEDQMASALINAIPGIEIMADNANAADLVAKWTSQGWYVIAQVYCNPWAVPVPPAQATADHWITLFGDASPQPYYQCWDATYRTIANLRECSHQGDAHWHLIVKLPGAVQTATTQTSGGTLAAEDDMFSDTDRAILTAIADAVKEREGSGPYVAFEWNGQKHGFKVRDSGVVEHDWWDGQRWQDENLKNTDATGRVAVLASGADVDWEIRADNSLHIDVLDKTLGSWHWHADPGGTFGTPDHQ